MAHCPPMASPSCLCTLDTTGPPRSSLATVRTARIFTSSTQRSAPPTQRDFSLQCRRLRPAAVNFTCHARQPRGSNECGLHVILISIIVAQTNRPPQVHRTAHELTLAAWRTLLIAMNKSGITDTHSHTLVKASPHISQTFRQLSCEPAGGAGAQIPLGDASSSSEDETIGDMQARQQHQATPDHVVVEADLPTRHITLDDIKSIGISVKHPQLQRGHKQRCTK
eukprot:PhM_4_TR2087/c4_g1_i2/m.91410